MCERCVDRDSDSGTATRNTKQSVQAVTQSGDMMKMTTEQMDVG